MGSAMMRGMRETVVLLHGFAGTGRGWDPVVARLDAQRYTALAPDLRGHGTRAGARPITFDAVAADILDARARPLRALRATRWAAASRSTSRSPRPSGSRA